MSDGSYQVPHLYTDNTYHDYIDAMYWVIRRKEEQERERIEHNREQRKLHRRILRKLQRFADWFDATFGWFFCPRRYPN